MPELISISSPKAKKVHDCQLCERPINIGETYDKQVLKYDGEIYAFKMHKRCNKISSLLWNFIDPDEGMTNEDFQDGVQEYCQRFVCPHCDNYEDGEGCKVNYTPIVKCLDLIEKRLKEHPLKQVKTKYGRAWKEE